MKKFLVTSLVISSFCPAYLMAQMDLDDEIDAEISRLYSGANNETSTSQSQAQQKAQSQGGPSIQINVQSNPQVTSKADTVTQLEAKTDVANKVEESNLDVSEDRNGLNQLKSTRKQLEIQNELKVVEKLETSRLEDEKSRTERLFGNKANGFESTKEKEVVMGKMIVSESPLEKKSLETMDKEAIRSEIRQTLLSLKSEEEVKEVVEGKPYFSTLIGLGAYQDVANVRGSYSLGFAVGQMMKKNVAVEGSFLFSEFDVEQRDGGYVCDYYYGCVQYPRITRMNQYQGGITAKYIPFEGSFKPYLGGSAAYTYRTFSDVQFAWPNNDAQSHALDVGLVAGIDLQVSEDFALGFDFKAFRNVTSRATNAGLQKSFARSVYSSDTPIESLDFTQMGITGKFSF
jgi:outer membrane protein W